ncbi:hypothetical protein CBR56_27835 [Bacillus thuringiensis]|uniref:Uncharacterized protein n=2 Tax=Claudivirus TaxID=2842609 RepID=A0A386KQ57_9CAUD|nr:hypothetical protein [Bacillus thuringiensis]YP_009292389.1 hypothetical protein MUK66_gp38 [Bacillus phage Aurora]YP_009910394.1 hypothetical protein H3015_gp03 [Bacillus phage vB_BthP-Goe4]AZV00051.1 hypothetical protein [Bacillus phage vB_BthP-HD73phi]ANT41152.1 hypothetical protein AURORA_38 [Bacillus phage Aurora]AYD87748.1 hypothetical protein Goe4_c00390 [Bacillus phage vB_BthP-Goe4]PNK23096.1 hypothetical protein CBR56_27835 [Bacillus thuringiensis]PNK43070.1 hypothetical protein 
MNNNNFDQYDVFIQNELHKGNKLKNLELAEKRAMRKAYCKANNIEFEELPTMEENLSNGSLKILCFVMWLFIAGTIISAFIGEGNFLTNFMKVWF